MVLFVRVRSLRSIINYYECSFFNYIGVDDAEIREASKKKYYYSNKGDPLICQTHSGKCIMSGRGS